MQLRLTIEELEILKNLVEDEKRLCRDAVPSLPQVSTKSALQDRWSVGRDLAVKGLARNLQLGFDELEDLADSLARHKKQLTTKIQCLTEPATRRGLERELVLLKHFLDKVTEACAML